MWSFSTARHFHHHYQSVFGLVDVGVRQKDLCRNRRLVLLCKLPLLLHFQFLPWYHGSILQKVTWYQLILIDFGLSLSTLGSDSERIPSRYSAMMRSGSSWTGRLIVRSKVPAMRSRRCMLTLPP